MRGLTLVVLFLICIGIVRAQSRKQTEGELFQACYDRKKAECFSKCEREGPTLWDRGLTALLGKRVIRGSSYTNCQSNCITDAHVECTEENLDRGGVKVFKLFGKWPIKRVWVFEEFASFAFCLSCMILYCYLFSRYSKAVNDGDHRAYGGFEYFHKMYYWFWIFTFFCAAVFHTKDTFWTERFDYFAGFLTIMYTSFAAIQRIFWVTNFWQRSLIAFIHVAYSIYHIYYMTFVSFDYGYNMKVLISVGIFDGLLWFWWCWRYKASYAWRNILAQLTMWSLSVFEIADFPPLFGYIDPHSLWHLSVMLVGICWTSFLIHDAEHFLKAKGPEKAK